jgi:hypothetical protein
MRYADLVQRLICDDILCLLLEEAGPAEVRHQEGARRQEGRAVQRLQLW